jgi:hypothetical protein
LQIVKEIEGYCDVSGRADNLLSAGTLTEWMFTLFYFTFHIGQMGAVKIYLSEGDLTSHFISFEAVNKTKCSRRARFSKTGLHEEQGRFNCKIYPYHDATCQHLPITSYKSPYLLWSWRGHRCV